MNTEIPHTEQAEAADESRKNKGIRAFMKRPVTLISTVAVVGAAVLGVVVLGDLSGTENPAATVASKTYKPVDGDEIISE